MRVTLCPPSLVPSHRGRVKADGPSWTFDQGPTWADRFPTPHKNNSSRVRRTWGHALFLHRTMGFGVLLRPGGIFLPLGCWKEIIWHSRRTLTITKLSNGNGFADTPQGPSSKRFAGQWCCRSERSPFPSPAPPTFLGSPPPPCVKCSCPPR